MRRVLIALFLLAPPLWAEEVPLSPRDPLDEGVDLMQRGLGAILDGLGSRMEPALRDMGEAVTKLRPLAEELLRLVDDIGNYEAPVVLENGDILIRRKPRPPAPPVPPVPPKEGEVDL